MERSQQIRDSHQICLLKSRMCRQGFWYFDVFVFGTFGTLMFLFPSILF